MSAPLVDPVLTQNLPPVPDGGEAEEAATERPMLRQPAVPAAVSLAVGIAADRFLNLDGKWWLLAGGVAVIVWCVLWRVRYVRPAAVVLLIGIACLGGARHHQYWSVIPADDISRFAGERPKLVRVRGIVASRPTVRSLKDDRSRPAWARIDSTAGMIECRSLGDADRTTRVTGRLRFSIDGHVLHVEAGDEVEILGWLRRPRGPQNPGEFDFREYLRRQRIFCVLSADHPDAVRRVGDTRRFLLQRWADRHRAEGNSFLVRSLSPESVPVAAALFLGDRSHMTEELRVLFTESGLMHVLAISGVNVGILAVSLWFCCRLLQLAPGWTSAAVLAVVVWYAFLTGGEPPVVRAAVLVGLVALGRPWRHRVLAGNILALSAIVVLMWNPSDLFQIGAQLSFLAVMAILWASGWKAMRQATTDPFARLRAEAGVERWLGPLAGTVKQGYLLSFAIALVTVPLIAYEFHLVSPVGIAINVLLMPLVTVVLWLGYGLLFCGYLLPEITPPVAWAFDGLMRRLVAAVEWAGETRFGHFYTPAPPLWWMTGYYAALVLLVTCGSRLSVKRFGTAGIAGWCVLGLVVGLVPPRPDGLRCTFLSVGHGGAVLIELPDGRTLLYDGGSLSSGRRAGQAVLHSLWARRRSRIDAVVVSHADVDHFNGVPMILQTVPVGALLMSPASLDFEQEAMRELCEAAAARGVPIRLLGAGDRLSLGDEVTCEVMHPEWNGRAEQDNENSLVLRIEYAGRRILLTGDLEGAGLARLLSLPPCRVDVLLSPHHGSPSANPRRLVDWAGPRYAVISGGHDEASARLRDRYGTECRLLSTAEAGAITFAIASDGELSIETSAIRADCKTVFFLNRRQRFGDMINSSRDVSDDRS